eukprot:TsM_000715100 transcript=TsM_000715100 gene=TsM_000715100
MDLRGREAPWWEQNGSHPSSLATTAGDVSQVVSDLLGFDFTSDIRKKTIESVSESTSLAWQLFHSELEATSASKSRVIRWIANSIFGRLLRERDREQEGVLLAPLEERFSAGSGEGTRTKCTAILIALFDYHDLTSWKDDVNQSPEALIGRSIWSGVLPPNQWSACVGEALVTAVRATFSTKGRRGLSPYDFPVALGTLIHLSIAVTAMNNGAGERGAGSNEIFSKRKVFCIDSCVLTHICFAVNFSFLVIHLVTLISFKKLRPYEAYFVRLKLLLRE